MYMVKLVLFNVDLMTKRIKILKRTNSFSTAKRKQFQNGPFIV